MSGFAARLRLAARVAGMLGAVAVAVPLHGAWRLAGRRSPWPRRFLGWMARLSGAHVTTEGTPLARDVVFLANHLSWVDILALAGATGTAFVAKAELGAGFVGWMSRLNHTIFVARGDRMGVGAQVSAIGDALRDGWAVTLFPEGTTGDGSALLPFKTSLLAVLEPPPPGVRVQPVLIAYSAPELAWPDDEPGASHAKRVLERRGRFAVRLRFLEPFDPLAVGGRKAVAAEARRRMVAALAG